MAKSSSFGLFSRLPYELREQIWLEFLPVGLDTRLGIPFRRKTYLDILRASRGMYAEISNCLYSNACLQFDLSPLYFQDPLAWTTVYFSKTNRRGKGTIENKTTWRLLSRKVAKRRGFYDFRPHPRIEIVVNLFAPDPKDPGQLFWMWRNATRLVEIFEEAPPLPHLKIRFQKCEAQDWCSSMGMNSSIESFHDEKYDHDIVLLPFFKLRNIIPITIKSHSEELKSMMDWGMVNCSSEPVSKAKSSSVTGNIDRFIRPSKHNLDERIANDYFRIHQELFSTCCGKTADFMRRIWLSSWFIEGRDGRSEFEERMIHIINTYPEIIYRYDRGLKNFELMHRVMIIMHHNAIVRQDEYIHWSSQKWLRWVWFAEYKDGIPGRDSSAFADDISDLLLENEDIYSKYACRGDFFSRTPRVIEEWQSRHIKLEDRAPSSVQVTRTQGNASAD